MIGSACLIITRPKGVELATHGLRTAWAMFTSALEPQVLLLGDGVYNALGNPGYNTQLLTDYLTEGGAASCLRRDLESRGLNEGQLLQGINTINEDQVAEIVEESNGVLTF